MWVVAIGQVTRPGAILRHRPSRPLGEFKSPHRLEPIGCLPHGCGIRVGRRPDFPPPSLRPTRGRAGRARTGGDAKGRPKLQTDRLCTSRAMIGPGGDGRGPVGRRRCDL